MRRIVLEIEYHGAGFFGWQRQGPNRSVQATLEAAAADLLGAPVALHASGRTDRGVHALGMAAHLDVESRLPCAELLMALNARLPEDVSVRSVREADPRFHARFDALGKLYRYSLYLSRSRSPLQRDRTAFMPRALDARAMAEAAALLVGTHDFASFRTNPDDEPGDEDDDGPEVTADLFGPAAVQEGSFVAPPWRKPRPNGTVRTIATASVREHNHVLRLEVRGNGFLRGMVRAIAGSLVEVGLGKQPPGWLRQVMDSRDRRAAGANLPACGLTLVRVEYPAEPFAGREAAGNPA